MIYEMLYAMLPYEGKNDIEMELLVEHVPLVIPYFPRVSREMRNLIENCLQFLEVNRFSWD